MLSFSVDVDGLNEKANYRKPTIGYSMNKSYARKRDEEYVQYNE